MSDQNPPHTLWKGTFQQKLLSKPKGEGHSKNQKTLETKNMLADQKFGLMLTLDLYIVPILFNTNSGAHKSSDCMMQC